MRLSHPLSRFLFNPFTIATCLARPTIVFSNTVILASIAHAVKGRPALSVLLLALSAYLSLYPALLLPPLILLGYDCILQKTPAKKLSLTVGTNPGECIPPQY